MSYSAERKTKRRELRAPVSPLLRWRGKSGEYDACVSNVSPEGCFLNTTGPAEIGDVITFVTSLPTDEIVLLQCRVIHCQRRPVGFGVRFEELSDIARFYIRLLMEDAQKEA